MRLIPSSLHATDDTLLQSKDLDVKFVGKCEIDKAYGVHYSSLKKIGYNKRRA
jgi:hypothetical protein